MKKDAENYLHPRKIFNYFTTGNLLPIVEKILSKRNSFLALTEKYKTPFYAYDQEELDGSVERFMKAFQSHIPRFQGYYAMKLNHHPLVTNRVVENGMGLDVASKRELSMAIKAGASKIVYFSPGKSDDDLVYAVKHADTVRIHIDSFDELRRLGTITNKMQKHVEAGIRIHTPSHGLWSKYGIPLKTLKKFWKEADDYSFVKLNGIHFHQSRNRTVDFYRNTISEIAEYINKHFSLQDRKNIQYIDFGGGFEPYRSEGIFIENQSKRQKYRILTPPTIEEYARTIGDAIKKYLDPIVEATYSSEPGRYICNGAMHIVLSVADVKDKENCILNGGVNMVGWQRFENEYFPLINLTHPSKTEKPYHMWGNLCTTWDIWGYYCYAKKLLEKDVIVVPYQGALTYSLAQSFINDIPPVYALSAKRPRK
jgi:diaminopimelate decarboxylase